MIEAHKWFRMTMAWAIVSAAQQGLCAIDMVKVGTTFNYFVDPYSERDAIVHGIMLTACVTAGGFGAFIWGLRLCCCGLGIFLQIPFITLGPPPARDPTTVGLIFLILFSVWRWSTRFFSIEVSSQGIHMRRSPGPPTEEGTQWTPPATPPRSLGNAPPLPTPSSPEKVEVPVEKVVHMKVEVPVEKIVEKKITVPVEVVKEAPTG